MARKGYGTGTNMICSYSSYWIPWSHLIYLLIHPNRNVIRRTAFIPQLKKLRLSEVLGQDLISQDVAKARLSPAQYSVASN